MTATRPHRRGWKIVGWIVGLLCALSLIDTATRAVTDTPTPTDTPATAAGQPTWTPPPPSTTSTVPTTPDMPYDTNPAPVPERSGPERHLIVCAGGRHIHVCY